MKISACIIAKNEEKVIARCIESYREAVDEVIVVDTGSTDQTIAIAKSLGAKLFHFTWNDDFAAAKNYAISKAKGDWIVFLDADEYFANHTGSNIRTVLKKMDGCFNSIACKMINIDQLSGKVLDEITHVRIFKNDKQIRYINPIHEMLQNLRKGKKINAFMADIKDIVIYHTGYSFDNRQKKAERNLALLLKELPHAPEQPAYYQYIADCYFGLGEWENVIKYTKLFFDSGAKLISYNVRPHQNLIDAMLQLKYDDSDIMREINLAIEKFSYHPLFRFYKANLLYDQKKYDKAFLEHQEALNLHVNYTGLEINSLHINLWMIYNTMGAISEHRNDYNAAIGYYIESLKLDNHNEQCFDRLMMLIRMQSTQDIILLLNTLYDLEIEADLHFLAACLVNHAVPKVLAYYTSLREKKYSKQDYIVLQMLVANKYYDKAFLTLLDCYIQDRDERLATVAATAAALSCNAIYIAQCLEQLPINYARILKAYRGEAIGFADEDKPAFLNLVHTFILWADVNALDKLINLVGQFPNDMTAELGSLFVREGYYEVGLHFYESAMNQALAMGMRVLSTLYYNQGYCFHRLNKPVDATEAFINAYEAGYRVNDIYEFMRWNVVKLDSSDVKERVKEILQDEIEENGLVH